MQSFFEIMMKKYSWEKDFNGSCQTRVFIDKSTEGLHMPSSQRYNANYCQSKGHDKYQDEGQSNQPARAAMRGSPEAVATVEVHYDDRPQPRSTHSATTQQSRAYFYKNAEGVRMVAGYNQQSANAKQDKCKRSELSTKR